MDCTTLTLAYIPLNYMPLDCDDDGVFLLFFSSSFWSPDRMRKTWLIHLAQSLTWQIIRSEGPTLHNHHNKASPVGPTRVSPKLEQCAMFKSIPQFFPQNYKWQWKVLFQSVSHTWLWSLMKYLNMSILSIVVLMCNTQRLFLGHKSILHHKRKL